MLKSEITESDIKKIINKSSVIVYAKHRLQIDLKVGRNIYKIYEADSLDDIEVLGNKKSKGIVIKKSHTKFVSRVSKETFAIFKSLVLKNHNQLIKNFKLRISGDFNFKIYDANTPWRRKLIVFVYKDLQVEIDRYCVDVFNLVKHKKINGIRIKRDMDRKADVELYSYFCKIINMYKTYELELKLCSTANQRKDLYEKVKEKLVAEKISIQ